MTELLSSPLFAILTAVLGSYVALLQYTMAQKEKAIENNDLKLTKEVEALELKLASIGTEQSKLSSELQLQALRHDHLLSAFKDIRESMVTKGEFDVSRRSTQDQLNLILFELRRGRTSSQQFHAPNFSTDPPKVK